MYQVLHLAAVLTLPTSLSGNRTCRLSRQQRERGVALMMLGYSAAAAGRLIGCDYRSVVLWWDRWRNKTGWKPPEGRVELAATGDDGEYSDDSDTSSEEDTEVDSRNNGTMRNGNPELSQVDNIEKDPLEDSFKRGGRRRGTTTARGATPR